MSAARGPAMSLAFAQLVATISVIMYYPDKRPLFTYTVKISDFGLSSAFSHNNLTLSLDDGSAYPSASNAVSNPYMKAAHHARYASEQYAPSHIYPYQYDYFVLFMVPSLACVVYSFMVARAVDAGSLNDTNSYGDHGWKDNLMNEAIFWFFVLVQHFVFLVVMTSPTDQYSAICFAQGVAIVLFLFCTLAVNTDEESIARRFEALIIIILCLLYISVMQSGKVVTSRQFTYLAWFGHILTNVLLLIGHLWENPVSTMTVIHSRWFYVIMGTWFNIVMYIAS